MIASDLSTNPTPDPNPFFTRLVNILTAPRFIAARPRPKFVLSEFLHFGFKQAWACLFGGLMLAALVITKLLWSPDLPLSRYDFMFIFAIAVQIAFVRLRLETPQEIKVIFIFHIVGTVMEIFKTHMGSWAYPEENLIRIGGVPLFSGFMYSAVGSYIARVWRIFDFKFTNYPRRDLTVLLCALIYINFFTHHFTADIRLFLFAFTIILYARTWVYYKPHETHQKMPLLLGFFLVSFFIWIAENAGTFAAAWRYPDQTHEWTIVSPHKMGAWFLLMIISFVLVTLLHKKMPAYKDGRGRD